MAYTDKELYDMHMSADSVKLKESYLLLLKNRANNGSWWAKEYVRWIEQR